MVSGMDLGDAPAIDDRAFNVGTSVGTSVNQLADALEMIAGGDAERRHEAERAGELRHSTLAADRLRTSGWKPERWAYDET